MNGHYLTKLFEPKTVAVFGASESPDAVGTLVFRNLLGRSDVPTPSESSTGQGFKGRIIPINPKYERVQGERCYPNLKEAGIAVDLAIITTPAATVADIVEQCGRQGVHAAVILSSGFREVGRHGEQLEKQVLEVARRYDLRFIGPNCLGIMRPAIRLNATFYQAEDDNDGNGTLPGDLALVSQSGALCTAILDWASGRELGFSSVISTGISADVDFGEILDYLVLDSTTHSVLLYIEGLHDARSFLSGLRAAARMKPVIVLKVGRYQTSSAAAMSHTGALVGADDVFNAALERAGVVRAHEVSDFFVAAQVLSMHRKVSGDRLCIITNGGGPGVMACDAALDRQLPLSKLDAQTITQLNGVLPANWSQGNPVDLIGDATPERYAKALEICLADVGTDNLLIILTPQAMTRPLAVAQIICDKYNNSGKPIIVCWMGDRQVEQARRLFQKNGIAHFSTPEVAVKAFSYLIRHFRNQKLLLQTPGAFNETGTVSDKAPLEGDPVENKREADLEGARLIIESLLAEGRHHLSELESKVLLRAFQIPVAQAIMTRSPNEALIAAESVGFPVVLKISSPDIIHKTDAGGVRLGIANAMAVRAAYNDMMREVGQRRAEAKIDGIVVEQMITRGNGRELMVGMLQDPVFGPVISFGYGGTTVEVVGDRAVALPPLNRFLVRDLIGKTRVHKLLQPFRHMPPVNMVALEAVLLRVSEMACELPWVKEMEINPLIVDERGTVAVDARMRVDYAPAAQRPYGHMAIHPYPAHLVTCWQAHDGTDMLIRPIRPEDAGIEQQFVRSLSDRSRYLRFMHGLGELPPEMLARFTQIDYDREMALIAVVEREGHEKEVGVCRYAINPDKTSCEFAVVVADEIQHTGLGYRLMEMLIQSARARGLERMMGEVLRENKDMLEFARSLGFSAHDHPDDRLIKVIEKHL